MAPPPSLQMQLGNLVFLIFAAAASIISSSSAAAELLTKATAAADHQVSLSCPLHREREIYAMQFRIGNAAVSGIADTGSGLIWTNSTRLLEDDFPMSCPADSVIERPCEGLCTFDVQYGGSSSVSGIMGRAKLGFPGDKSGSSYDVSVGAATKVGGCPSHSSSTARDDNGGSTCRSCKAYKDGGIVGLGRSQLSLVSQLRLSNFSYCLPLPGHVSSSEEEAEAASTAGHIWFNDTVTEFPESRTNKTNLLSPTTKAGGSNGKDWYYMVGLEAVQVGEAVTLVSDGCSEGMVVDSGSAFTTLPVDVFTKVKGHLEKIIKDKRKQAGLPEELIPQSYESDGDHDHGCSVGGGETTERCYKEPYPQGMGSMVLHFCGGGQMEIPAENYLIKTTEGFCLALKPRSDVSILGAYQQRGMHMLFDLANNKLSFMKHSPCGAAKSSQEDSHLATHVV